MKDNNAFAEVISSSLQGFVSQSWKWNQFPPFGSLVTAHTKTRDLFGIVHQIQTGSMDSSRSPFPYKKTEEELLREQPQIFEFLKTTFSTLTIGYQEKGKLHSFLSPEPPTIHSLVNATDPIICKNLLNAGTYLPLLFGSSQEIFNIDELLLAILQQKTNLKILSQESLQTFINTFSLLTGNDYRRLKLFLQRAQTIVTFKPAEYPLDKKPF